MNKSMKMNSQGGFTLIELIVVIVILGILAATALPRFSNLGGDARVASLNAARGALTATAAMAHGRWLVAPAATQNVEGAVVTMNAASGYPDIQDANGAPTTAGLLQAAGLANDYTAAAAGAGDPARSFRIVPNNVVNTPTAATCFLTYAAPTARNALPVVALGANVDAASCQ